MASEKVTVMILNVDLKCPCCYKKVKKLLCKLPQIRDQVFHEDKNKVMITVVCCDPEKIRDKLCCKGGKAIQSIEIVENKPKPPEKPKPVLEPAEKPKPKPEATPPPKPDPPKVDPPKPDPPKVDPPKPAPPKVDPPKPDPPKADPPKKPDPAPAPPPVAPPPEPVNMPGPMAGYPQPFCPPQVPVSVCCQECYEGRPGGPCHYGYGRPVPPPPGPCYDGAYGYQYGGNINRPCYVRCDYFSEENPQGCSVM